MTKWKVCEKKECHMMVRYITGGEITVTVVRGKLSDDAMREAERTCKCGGSQR